MKILFVCTGNTCRSPMAEAMFRSMIQDDPLGEQLMCQSAGLSANPGDPPADNAVAVLAEIGIPLEEHRARRLTPEEIPVWDAYFTMSKTHGYILEKGGVPAERIYVPSYIEDPFGGDIAVYRACRDKLREELALFLEQLREVLARKGEGEA